MMTTSTITYLQTPKNVCKFLDEVKYDPHDPMDSRVLDYVADRGDRSSALPELLPEGVVSGELTLTDGGSGITYIVPESEREEFAPSLTPNVDSKFTVRVDGETVGQGTIRPTHPLRLIDGSDGFDNARDIGGIPCDGGTIRYGKFFRGSEIRNAETARRILVDRLGVRAELELRGMSERRAKSSPLGSDIRYFCPEHHQYYTVSGREIWKILLRYAFDCVRDGLPLYFHCAAGADRTGTFACMIEALLGVSRENIDLDFELTNFSRDDEAWRLRKSHEWRGLMFELYEELPARRTLRDRVISYIGSLGFTSDEINAFRHAMIDGTPEDIDLDTINDVKITEFYQVDPTVDEYLKNTHYTLRDVATSSVLEYSSRDTGRDKSKPLSYTFDTQGAELHVHDRGAHTEYVVTDGTVSGLVPGVDSTYTVVRNGQVEDFGIIRANGTLRAIDGGVGLRNLRDLGGLACDGGTVRYSRIFRGGQIEEATEARRVLVDRLGVRAELDLKGNMYSWAEHSLLGEDIRYCRPKACRWYMLGDPITWREMLGFVFESVKNKEPLYVHCAGGADRTGTLVCILLALLGVSEEDIEKDLELTNFADTGRIPLRSGMDWRKFRVEINSVVAGENFSEHVISWVASLGFTEDDINSFRRAMINGNPEKVDLTRINNTHIVEYSHTNPAVEAYLSDVTYDFSEHETTHIKEYIKRDADYDKSLPFGAKLHTEGGVLHVYDRYTGITYEENVSKGDICIKNVCPRIGADYKIIRDGAVTERGFLRPIGALRMIDCGKAAVNIRDLGGKYCKGGRISYGKLYRGGAFLEPIEARAILHDRLGIGADLNLRGNEESPETVSPLGEDILYCRPAKCQWYTISDKEMWKEMLGFVFDCVERGIPLYFHCYGGADRTGTLACIIEALLGVSEEDIEKDYELTNFEQCDIATRLRTMKGEYQWGNLIRQLGELPGDGNLQKRVESWVMNDLGFTIEQVARFKHVMTDDRLP